MRGGATPVRSSPANRSSRGMARVRTPSELATTFMVPPPRMAMGGKACSPSTRTRALRVRCSVPSPPWTAITEGGRAARARTSSSSAGSEGAAITRPESPRARASREASRGFFRLARECGLTNTAITGQGLWRCLNPSRSGRSQHFPAKGRARGLRPAAVPSGFVSRGHVGIRLDLWLGGVVVVVPPLGVGGRARRGGHLCNFGIPVFEHGDDLPGLLLAGDIERRLLAIATLALLEAHDGHLGCPKFSALSVQLLEEEHQGSPAALGEHRSLQLLANQLAVFLIIVGQFVECLGHGKGPRAGRQSSGALGK